jgi:hypothetical protein
MQDNFLWTEKREFSRAEAWIDILWEVRWSPEPETVLLGNKVLVCNYAESLKSLDTWAHRWNWNRSSVWRFLKLLQTRNMIVLKSETVTTRITVCNYERYDIKRNANETDLKRIRNGFETDLKTEEKGKKEIRKKEKTKILSASGDAEQPQTTVFYLTKKKRKLTGKRLETFELFWKAFAYPKGKAEAADAWMDIPELRNCLVAEIVEAAKKEAANRHKLISDGRTPKWAQGWITGKRWEDEDFKESTCWDDV